MKKHLAKLAGAALLLTAAPALAYLLPGWSLVRRTQTRREDLHLHSLKVTGTFTFTGPAAQAMATRIGVFTSDGQLEVPATLNYKMPGRCRLELQLPGVAPAQQPFAASRNGTLTGSPDLALGQRLLALSCPLLSSRGGDDGTHALVESIKGLGIGFQTTSLARFDGTIAEVIGTTPHAKQPEPSISIDKDSFVIVRVLARQKDGAGLDDLRLEGTGAPGGGDAHPRDLSLWQPDASGTERLAVRFSAEKLEPNAQVPDAIF